MLSIASFCEYVKIKCRYDGMFEIFGIKKKINSMKELIFSLKNTKTTKNFSIWHTQNGNPLS